jgi:hypothetical protein
MPGRTPTAKSRGDDANTIHRNPQGSNHRVMYEVSCQEVKGYSGELTRPARRSIRSCREVGGNWLRRRRFRSARSRRNPRHEASYASLGSDAITVRRERLVPRLGGAVFLRWRRFNTSAQRLQRARQPTVCEERTFPPRVVLRDYRPVRWFLPRRGETTLVVAAAASARQHGSAR